MSFLKEIEKNLKIKAKIKFLKKQKGDVEETCSSIKKMSNYIKLKKRVDYRKGIKKFINWYLDYYKI
jgi:UDP-glucuronate 4-epimerase